MAGRKRYGEADHEVRSVPVLVIRGKPTRAEFCAYEDPGEDIDPVEEFGGDLPTRREAHPDGDGLEGHYW